MRISLRGQRARDTQRETDQEKATAQHVFNNSSQSLPLVLRAKMDIRAPRANRGTGFKSQGCYRPDAVSARPMGHLSRRSLSISLRKVIGNSFTGR